MRSYLLLIFICLLITSCRENRNLVLAIEKIDVSLLEKEEILIIPYHGCSNCITKAFKYLKREPNELNRAVVFTNYSSTKEIKLRLQSLDLNLTGALYTNKHQELMKDGISHFYPSLLRKSAGQDWVIDIVNPSSTVLD